MQSDSKSRSNNGDMSGASANVIPSWIRFGANVADAGVTALFGVAQDFRTEAKSAVGASIDCAEELAKGVVRFGRKVTDRIDVFGQAALGSGETAVGATLQAAQATGDEAAQLVGRAATAITGESRPAAQA